MGQNRQLLPCAVGGVMVGRYGVEREFSLELGKVLCDCLGVIYAVLVS